MEDEEEEISNVDLAKMKEEAEESDTNDEIESEDHEFQDSIDDQVSQRDEGQKPMEDSKTEGEEPTIKEEKSKTLQSEKSSTESEKGSVKSEKSSIHQVQRSQTTSRLHSKNQKLCQRRFREMIGRRELKNEELGKQEVDLRQRLDLLECSMPAVMVWNIWRMAQGVPASKLHRVIEKQFQGPASGEVFCPNTPSRHFDCRVREVEAERKEAQKRADEARQLWSEKTVALEDRKRKLEEARKIHEERKERIHRLTIEEKELREALEKIEKTDGACEAGECGDIQCKQRWLNRVSSSSSIRSSDVECLERLHDLAEAELSMKRQIEDLERREDAYMRTLQQADELWTKVEGDTASTLSALQEQLDSKTVENERMADRISELEEEIERLRERLTTCRNELEKFLSIETIEALIGSDDDLAELSDKATMSGAMVEYRMIGGEDDFAGVGEKGVLVKEERTDEGTATIKMEMDEEVLAKEELMDAGTEYDSRLEEKSVSVKPELSDLGVDGQRGLVDTEDAQLGIKPEDLDYEEERLREAREYLAQLGSIDELYYDDDYGVCEPDFACNDEVFTATGMDEEELAALQAGGAPREPRSEEKPEEVEETRVKPEPGDQSVKGDEDTRTIPAQEAEVVREDLEDRVFKMEGDIDRGTRDEAEEAGGTREDDVDVRRVVDEDALEDKALYAEDPDSEVDDRLRTKYSEEDTSPEKQQEMEVSVDDEKKSRDYSDTAYVKGIEIEGDDVRVSRSELSSWLDSVNLIRATVAKCPDCRVVKKDADTLAQRIAELCGSTVEEIPEADELRERMYLEPEDERREEKVTIRSAEGVMDTGEEFEAQKTKIRPLTAEEAEVIAGNVSQAQAARYRTIETPLRPEKMEVDDGGLIEAESDEAIVPDTKEEPRDKEKLDLQKLEEERPAQLPEPEFLDPRERIDETGPEETALSTETSTKEEESIEDAPRKGREGQMEESGEERSMETSVGSERVDEEVPEKIREETLKSAEDEVKEIPVEEVELGPEKLEPVKAAEIEMEAAEMGEKPGDYEKGEFVESEVIDEDEARMGRRGSEEEAIAEKDSVSTKEGKEEEKKSAVGTVESVEVGGKERDAESTFVEGLVEEEEEREESIVGEDAKSKRTEVVSVEEDAKSRRTETSAAEDVKSRGTEQLSAVEEDAKSRKTEEISAAEEDAKSRKTEELSIAEDKRSVQPSEVEEVEKVEEELSIKKEPEEAAEDETVRLAAELAEAPKEEAEEKVAEDEVTAEMEKPTERPPMLIDPQVVAAPYLAVADIEGEEEGEEEEAVPPSEAPCVCESITVSPPSKETQEIEITQTEIVTTETVEIVTQTISTTATQTVTTEEITQQIVSSRSTAITTIIQQGFEVSSGTTVSRKTTKDQSTTTPSNVGSQTEKSSLSRGTPREGREKYPGAGIFVPDVYPSLKSPPTRRFEVEEELRCLNYPSRSEDMEKPECNCCICGKTSPPSRKPAKNRYEGRTASPRGQSTPSSTRKNIDDRKVDQHERLCPDCRTKRLQEKEATKPRNIVKSIRDQESCICASMDGESKVLSIYRKKNTAKRDQSCMAKIPRAKTSDRGKQTPEMEKKPVKAEESRRTMESDTVTESLENCVCFETTDSSGRTLNCRCGDY